MLKYICKYRPNHPPIHRTYTHAHTHTHKHTRFFFSSPVVAQTANYRIVLAVALDLQNIVEHDAHCACNRRADVPQTLGETLVTLAGAPAR